MEELEGERSRLEQEKQALEMQMERLTLQVGNERAREMCPAQSLLAPAPMNETLDFLLHICPYLAESYSWVLHRPVPPVRIIVQGPPHALVSLLLSTDLSFCSLWCCPPSLPLSCGHDLPCCLHQTVSFLFSFLPPDHTAHGKKPTG